MPSSTIRVTALLAELSKALTQLGLRWYVFGAQAAIIHGAGRLTADVDVTLDLGRMPVAELLRALAKRGFAAQIPDSSFIEVTRVIPLVHQATHIPVDLVLAGPGLEDLFFERALAKKVGKTTINVASLEDLIVMKILSGRPKDIGDVETLLAVREDDVDLSLVRETLRLAEELLDQSDLSPMFEQLVSRTVQKARRVRTMRRGWRAPAGRSKATKKRHKAKQRGG
jgi:hypothetical protein